MNFSECLKYNTVLRSRLCHVTQHSLPQKKAEKGDERYKYCQTWQRTRPQLFTTIAQPWYSVMAVRLWNTLVSPSKLYLLTKQKISLTWDFRCCTLSFNFAYWSALCASSVFVGKVSWIYHSDQSVCFLSDVVVFRKNSAGKCLAFSSHETCDQTKTCLLETITVLLPE